MKKIASNWAKIDQQIAKGYFKRHLDENASEKLISCLQSKNIFKSTASVQSASGHTHLIIGSSLLSIPFESLSMLKGAPITRYFSPQHFLMSHNLLRTKNDENRYKKIFYLLNPDGTLGKSETRIKAFCNKTLNTK